MFCCWDDEIIVLRWDEITTSAIAWAAKKLPDIPRDLLEAEFNSLDSGNGKKALAWIKYIERQTQNF